MFEPPNRTSARAVSHPARLPADEGTRLVTRAPWRRAGRVLVLVCLGLVSLPLIYVVLTYALVVGFYAAWGAVGLVLGLLDLAWLRSAGDLGSVCGLGFWVSATLLLCAAALRIVWVVVRNVVRVIGPAPATDDTRRRQRSTELRRWGVAALVPILLGVAWIALPTAVDARLKTHVTIYLDPAVVASGGALVVAGIAVPEDAWRAVPPGDNPAMLDPSNPKAAEVGAGDRHFGAHVTTSVAVVEFRYPEGGTYTFNIRPSPETETALRQELATELVSIGSASMMIDPETGGDLAWPSVNVVAILGPNRDAAWARLADHMLTDAFDEGVGIRHYEGVRTLQLSEEQVRRLIAEQQD